MAVPNTLRARDRVAAGFLLVLMLVGSFALWVGVPAGGLWLTGKLTHSRELSFPLALILIPTGMALFAIVLVWLNGLYLRITGAYRIEDDMPVRLRGPLEPILVGSLVTAIVAISIWFFFFAHTTLINPTTW
jgi:hypothetical protein